MDGRSHSHIFFIVIIPIIILYLLFGLWKYIPLLILANSICDADEDQKWREGRYHRSFLTHSVLWPLLISAAIWLPFSQYDISFLFLFITLSLANAVHMACDIYSKNPRGKYCILLFKSRLSVGGTRFWLVFNIAAIIAALVLFLW